MTPDKRIDWCRENIPGFKACHDQAEKAKKETEENRHRMKPAAFFAQPTDEQKQKALAYRGSDNLP